MAKKAKTHKTTAKRFRLSGTGKLIRIRGPHTHLKTHKSKRVKRGLNRPVVVEVHDFEKRMKQLANLGK
ncbi:MAG TPA: bL35 family ribosomal protein [Anaerolineae bacterium]|jgi:large subunit ribosomal protein L35